jgi:hypothetical protein
MNLWLFLCFCKGSVNILVTLCQKSCIYGSLLNTVQNFHSMISVLSVLTRLSSVELFAVAKSGYGIWMKVCTMSMLTGTLIDGLFLR